MADDASVRDGAVDPATPGARDLQPLLDHLRDRGATAEQLEGAVETDALLDLTADLALVTEGALPVLEAAARAGVPVDRLLRLRLASGIPTDESSWVPPASVLDSQAFELGAAMFGENAVLAFTRVMGASAARVAESEPRLTARGATLLEHAVANEEAIALIASVGDVLSHLLHEQLALAVRRARRARNPDTAAETSAVAVGFVDLVGSTRWAEGLTLKDHAVALARFESAAWDLATHHDGRLVKLIGDEAMFVAPAVTDACDIVTEQCSGVERDLDLPPARGAVGFGKVLTRDGDYFGPLVNLVARAVKEAPPGTVVVTDDVVAGLGRARSDRVTTPIGKRSLRGIEDRVALHALG